MSSEFPSSSPSYDNLGKPGLSKNLLKSVTGAVAFEAVVMLAFALTPEIIFATTNRSVDLRPYRGAIFFCLCCVPIFTFSVTGALLLHLSNKSSSRI